MPLTIDEKYQLYESAVQNPRADIDFINKIYSQLFARSPISLREDFGGTGYLACEWVKQSDTHRAYVVDLDREPIDYGKRTHYMALTPQQQERVVYLERDVLDDLKISTEVVVAFNFSYFIFKQRSKLKQYIQKVYDDLPVGGIFCVDLFGGEDAYGIAEEETEHEDFSYFWDCDKFNPLTNECLYYIHFKKHIDNIKHEKVFTYDWRMWSNAELRDLFIEIGFSEVLSFWEGVDEEGEGDGQFEQTLEAENCESWVTYLVGVKK